MNTDVRIKLRIEIENTREMFQRMLVSIPEDTLNLPSKDPTCTNAELLYGMATSPLIIKSILKRNFGTWSHLVLQKLVTAPLGQRQNQPLTGSRAQNSTVSLLADDFNNNCILLLQMLDEIPDDDFNKTLIVPYGEPMLSGPVTVEQLFHYVKNHFDLHRNQINLGK